MIIESPIGTNQSKSFGIHITENHLGTLFALFFVWARDDMGQKSRYLAQNAKGTVCQQKP